MFKMSNSAAQLLYGPVLVHHESTHDDGCLNENERFFNSSQTAYTCYFSHMGTTASVLLQRVRPGSASQPGLEVTVSAVAARVATGTAVQVDCRLLAPPDTASDIIWKLPSLLDSLHMQESALYPRQCHFFFEQS